MTNSDLISARKRLKFSQSRLSAVLGVGLRSYKRWEAGDIPVPGPVALAVTLMERMRKIAALSNQA